MTNSTRKNRVNFGITYRDNRWHVWYATSINWGTWGAAKLNGDFDTPEEAEQEARRQSQSKEWEGWDINFPR